MADPIVSGRVALITYTVADATTGEVLDTTGGEIYAYLHGAANFPEGLESVLEGLEPGAAFDATIAMADAYGPRKEGWPKVVPRRELKGVRDLHKGLSFRAEGASGASVLLWVADVKGSRVSIDANHPFAGRDLRFSGEVVLVRDATAEEHAHGHAHGLMGYDPH